jgi:hypothetical protein
MIKFTNWILELSKGLTVLVLLSCTYAGYGQQAVSSDCRDTVEFYSNRMVWKKYKKCPDGIKDTLTIYKTNGDLQAYFIYGDKNSNKPLTKHFFYQKGPIREVVNQYMVNTDKVLNVGAAKYYRKNGSLRDSIVYENGKEVYRARFNKKGKIISEQKTLITE